MNNRVTTDQRLVCDMLNMGTSSCGDLTATLAAGTLEMAKG
jgi:hypothetical protein